MTKTNKLFVVSRLALVQQGIVDIQNTEIHHQN